MFADWEGGITDSNSDLRHKSSWSAGGFLDYKLAAVGPGGPTHGDPAVDVKATCSLLTCSEPGQWFHTLGQIGIVVVRVPYRPYFNTSP